MLQNVPVVHVEGVTGEEEEQCVTDHHEPTTRPPSSPSTPSHARHTAPGHSRPQPGQGTALQLL